jgi:ASCH domain.
LKIHELKLDTEFFDDVKSGKKNFEIRKNDRNFEVGDTLFLFASGSCCHYCNGVSFKRFYEGTCSGWMNAYKNEADCLKAKVLEIYNAEQINPDLDIVNSKNYVANLHVVFF